MHDASACGSLCVSCELVHYSTPPSVITLMKSSCKAHRMTAPMVGVVVATAADGGNGDVIYDAGWKV